MLLTCAEMKEAENAAFARGIEAADLMERAGEGIAGIVTQFFEKPGYCLAVCGKGNNAGDVLVAARILKERGWRVGAELAYPEESFSPLAARHYAALREGFEPARRTDHPFVILDGLLGIGASGSPRDPVAYAVRLINRLRRERGAWVLAADIPSGLNGDTGECGDPCVEADCTAAIAYAKTGLLADTATKCVGRLAVVPLDDLPAAGGDRAAVLTPDLLREKLPPRPFDMHKGQAGRIGVLAGAAGLTGAGRLCSAAAVHGGGGLVTLLALKDAYPILAASVEPEVMVRPVDAWRDVLSMKFDVLAIGPGLGSEHREEIRRLVLDAPLPCVVDADALNAVDGAKLQGPFPAARLLTPHPGEMERLFPQGGRSRREWCEDFVAENPVTLLLKGSRTIIGERGYPSVYNTTGNPGMASGGMGDVLTGVCAALMAQGHSPFDAASLGAWLCGRAAECAVFGPGGSPESLCALDVIRNLGKAFTGLRGGDW
jgi:ADP-dependent NAD(P)H-hydrate dehydratase / NAD(P)H-hydrate epimerase